MGEESQRPILPSFFGYAVAALHLLFGFALISTAMLHVSPFPWVSGFLATGGAWVFYVGVKMAVSELKKG